MNVWVAPTIVDCEISPDLASMSITAPDGRRIALSAEQLRLACKCAHCRRAQSDNRFASSFPGIAIVAVTDLGYGVNISFSDGHSRGIYPKSYLAELAAI